MYEIKEKNGFRWYVRKGIPTDLEPIRDYEKFVLDVCMFANDIHGTFVDVGANVGKYAIQLSPAFAKVIAYEPLPENLETLKKNIELNNITNVIVREVAVGSKRGKAYLTRAYAQSRIVDKPEDNTIEVEIVTLDEDLENVDRPISLIKVDVEGFELEVVKGAIGITKRYKPIWVIEHNGYWHKHEDPNHVKIAKILVSNGYLPFAIDTVHWVYVPQVQDEDRVSRVIHYVFPYHVFYTVIVPNLRNGRAWYHGVPDRWWYGMSILEFIYHVDFNRDKELYVKSLSESLGIDIRKVLSGGGR